MNADSSYSYDQFIGELELAINDYFGPGLLEELIPQEELLEELAKTLEGEDEGMDVRISGRTIRLAFLNFLLVAYPNARLPEICARQPAYGDLTSPHDLVLQFAVVIRELSGCEKDPSAGWFAEPRAQRYISRLLPVFFHSFAEMGQDEALALQGMSLQEDETPIWEPCFWKSDEALVWNNRWGRYVDDFRFLSTATRVFSILPERFCGYAWIVLMRLATARPEFDMTSFAFLSQAIALECQSAPVPILN